MLSRGREMISLGDEGDKITLATGWILDYRKARME